MAIDRVPILIVFFATIAIVLIALEIGVFLGKRSARRDNAKREVSGAMVSATMGLVAFMLGFTFNGAAGRHDARKSLVVDEANAIEVAWLRAAFLAEPDRTSMRETLREYVDLRLKAAAGDVEMAQAISQSHALQEKMWALAEDAGRKNPGSIAVGLFIDAVNHTIDVHVKRVTVGLRNRVAPTIFVGLFLLMILGMGMIGAQVAHNAVRNRSVEIALALTFSIVLFLIVDLDRPMEGLIDVSQQAMVDVQTKLHAR